MVAAAHLGAQPLGDRADHLVGDVEAITFVEAGKIVDRDHQQAAGAALTDRLLQCRLQHLGEMPAVHFAGQAVEVRQVGQPLLLRVPLVDGMDDAVRALRLPSLPANQRPVSSIQSLAPPSGVIEYCT